MVSCIMYTIPSISVLAIAIDKGQGITVKEIIVDICPSKSQFQCGHIYVAFSIATTLEKM